MVIKLHKNITLTSNISVCIWITSWVFPFHDLSGLLLFYIYCFWMKPLFTGLFQEASCAVSKDKIFSHSWIHSEELCWNFSSWIYLKIGIWFGVKAVFLLFVLLKATFTGKEVAFLHNSLRKAKLKLILSTTWRSQSQKLFLQTDLEVFLLMLLMSEC